MSLCMYTIEHRPTNLAIDIRLGSREFKLHVQQYQWLSVLQSQSDIIGAPPGYICAYSNTKSCTYMDKTHCFCL